MPVVSKYKVGGAGCGACILKIQKIIKPLNGVDDAKFDLKTSTLTVFGEHDSSEVLAAMVAGNFTAEPEADAG